LIHSRYVGLVLRNISQVILSKEFLSLSILGNGLTFIFAGFFYWVENGPNPEVTHFIDAVWFSFSTVTTVGYGDITPITFWGRVLGILMMLIGTVFFVTFTALFSNAILASKIHTFEGHLKSEDQKIEELLRYYQKKKSEE
jgi:voltage-gated potassium channel